MTDHALPNPPIGPESAPFFAAAREGRFLIRRCARCARTHWHPRALCPFCFGETVWEEASGRGTVYSYSVMRRVPSPFAIAYVTLEEGPTMMTNLVECDLDALAIGQAVELLFRPSQDGTPVPCFRPL